MSRLGVLVKDNVVHNIIVWGDESEAQYEAEGWDYAIETTGAFPQPGIGWSYAEKDGFRPPKPFESWSWDGTVWKAPVTQPGDNYVWNEQTKTWDEIPTEEPTP